MATRRGDKLYYTKDRRQYEVWIKEQKRKDPNWQNTEQEFAAWSLQAGLPGRTQREVNRLKPPKPDVITEPPDGPRGSKTELELEVIPSKTTLKNDGKDFARITALAKWRITPPIGSGLKPSLRPAKDVQLQYSFPTGQGRWKVVGHNRPEESNVVGAVTDANGRAKLDYIGSRRPQQVEITVETQRYSEPIKETVILNMVGDEVVEPPGMPVSGFGGEFDDEVEPIDIPEDPFEPFVPSDEFIRLPEMDTELQPVQVGAVSGLETSSQTQGWGMDARTAKTVVPEPFVRLAQNVVYREKGAFVKRNGYNQINRSQPRN